MTFEITSCKWLDLQDFLDNNYYYEPYRPCLLHIQCYIVLQIKLTSLRFPPLT